MATAKQKAAARRNIKKAQAALRRRFGHRSRRSSRGSANGGSSSPGFAATYQQAKLGLQVASPLTNQGLAVLNGQDPRSVPDALIGQFRSPSQRASYAKGFLSSALQAWADRKLRVANALARKSVSAWAAEAYAVGDAVLENDLDPQATHDAFVENTSGYRPSSGGFSTRGKVRGYVFGKYGAAGFRKFLTKVPAIGDPVRAGLRVFGLSP